MGNGSNQYKKRDIDTKTIRAMQKYFDEGHSMRDVIKKFNSSFCKLYALQNEGKANFRRSKEDVKSIRAKKLDGFKHTDQTKKKLSKIRKEWIAKNPDKSPYIISHKSRGETYPEKYFREWLEKENIPFQQEYRFKLYAFDFLVNERVDLEIDGSQHKGDPVIVEHDKKRDKCSLENGFIVYRIDWMNYQKLSQEEKKNFLCELKKFLMDVRNPIPQFVIKKKQPKTPKIKQEDPRKKQALEMLKSGMNFCEVGREFKVSDNAIRKWLKSLGENPKDYGRDRNKKI